MLTCFWKEWFEKGYAKDACCFNVKMHIYMDVMITVLPLDILPHVPQLNKREKMIKNHGLSISRSVKSLIPAVRKLIRGCAAWHHFLLFSIDQIYRRLKFVQPQTMF